METCVLIPKQLTFVLTLNRDPRNIFEMDATIWSNETIPSGFVFYPDDGHIVHDNIDIFSSLPKDDVRHKFGCYELVLDISGEQVRHCNWIRFLQSSNDHGNVNIVALHSNSQLMYQVVKDILPNDELIVYFDEADLESSDRQSDTMDQPIECAESENDVEEIDVCDISLESSEIQSTNSSPTPTDSQIYLLTSPGLPHISHAGHALLTPASELSLLRDGDYRSGTSDVTTSDESATLSTPDATKELSPCQTTYSAVRHSTPVPGAMASFRRNRVKSWLSCQFCGKKFDRPSLLKRHERIHTGEKPHACDVCDKAFSTSSSLNTHRRIHSGEKPHQCPICGKRFTASSNLYYHRMTHTKDKPHKCTECSKSFPTPGDLRSHMYMHSGTWPFTCDVCHRGFSKQTNLKNHMLLHNDKEKTGVINQFEGELKHETQNSSTRLSPSNKQEADDSGYGSFNHVMSYSQPSRQVDMSWNSPMWTQPAWMSTSQSSPDLLHASYQHHFRAPMVQLNGGF